MLSRSTVQQLCGERSVGGFMCKLVSIKFAFLVFVCSATRFDAAQRAPSVSPEPSSTERCTAPRQQSSQGGRPLAWDELSD